MLSNCGAVKYRMVMGALNTERVVLLVASTFVLLWIIERLVPLRQPRGHLFRRLLLNLVMSGLAFGTAALLVRPVGRLALGWISAQSFGLLHLVKPPWLVEFVVGFLLLDLGFYYWHVANHRVPFLWRFHNVHHIDPELDVSTGFRFHFGEVALSAAFRAVQVGVIGVSFWTFAAYELVFQIETLFHHSNLRLPIRTRAPRAAGPWRTPPFGQLVYRTRR